MDVGSINMDLLLRIDSAQSENASSKPSLISSSTISTPFTFSPLGGVIGRSADCDWVLIDEERRLSGKHAAISFENNQYFITDISTNGLFINERNTPLGKSKSHPIKSGDRFVMGPYTLVAMIESTKTEEVLGEPIHQTSFVEHEHLINTGENALDEVLALPQVLATEVVDLEINVSEQTDMAQSLPVPQIEERGLEHDANKNAESPCINFLRGAGLDESLYSQQDINDLMLSFGKLLKSYTGELMNLMGERSRYKNRYRLDMTLVAPEHNNPLKYCVNEVQALREIVISPQPENLSGGAAVESAMEDIRNHFWRVEQAYQGTLSSMVDYLSIAGVQDNQPIKSLSTNRESIKPWGYRKKVKQLSRKSTLLKDDRYYTEEFLAPRFSYFYQNPSKVKQKEMNNE